MSLGVVGPKGLELSGRVADGTVLDWLSAPGFVRHARERIDAGRAAAGRTDPHRLTVFLMAAGDAATVRREVDARRAQGGEQERFMDAPLEHLAVLPGHGARDAAGAGGGRGRLRGARQPRPGGAARRGGAARAVA